MKRIPLSSLPYFQGMTIEDPDTLFFEFDVLCRRYDYTSDAQNMKLFPTTLKGATLRWFMGLGFSTIQRCGDMKLPVSKNIRNIVRPRN